MGVVLEETELVATELDDEDVAELEGIELEVTATELDVTGVELDVAGVELDVLTLELVTIELDVLTLDVVETELEVVVLELDVLTLLETALEDDTAIATGSKRHWELHQLLSIPPDCANPFWFSTCIY